MSLYAVQVLTGQEAEVCRRLADRRIATLLPQGMEVSEATRAAINTHLFLLGTSLLFGLGAMLIGGRSATMRPPSHDTPAP